MFASTARVPVVIPTRVRSTTNRVSPQTRATASDGVAPAIIVGGGRVGSALKDMGRNDVVIKRGDAFPETPKEGPIYVCTRNESLQGIIDWTPEGRREDLVFLQNGYLQGFLDERGLGGNTQALIYFAVAKLGEAPTDGVTDVNPEGLTAAYGKHAMALANRLEGANLACHLLDKNEFKASMFEKLIWISAFMLVGANHPGATVGDVESEYKNEVVELIDELIDGTSEAENVAFKPGSVDRLLAYARAVAHFPTAVKEFEWRNGFFHSVSEKRLGNGEPDPFLTHTALLKKVGAV